MKFTLEIELGNEGMQSVGEVADAIAVSLAKLLPDQPMRFYNGIIRDITGNTVGKWQVSE